MCFVLGAKGSEWAWQNKRWDSVEHFQRVQKKWALWGLGLYLLAAVAISASAAVYVEKSREALIEKAVENAVEDAVRAEIEKAARR